MNIRKLSLYTLFVVLLISPVYAAVFDLSYALNPLGGLNIAGFYLMYYQFIDAIIYLILFLSIAKFAFGKAFLTPDKKPIKEGRMIAVAVGLALTFSMVIVEMNTGFYLGQLAPVALLVFLVVLAILLYNLLQGLFEGEKAKAISASITYLIIYGLLVVPFGKLNQWIDQNIPLLSGLLSLASVAAFVFLIIQMFKMFGGGKDEIKVGPQGPIGPQGPPGPPGIVPPVPAQNNNTNTLTITSPTPTEYHAGKSIPVSFTVSGPGFANDFDYVIKLNGMDRGRIQNIQGPVVNCEPLKLNGPEVYKLEITAYQKGSNIVIATPSHVTFDVEEQQIDKNIDTELKRIVEAIVKGYEKSRDSLHEKSAKYSQKYPENNVLKNITKMTTKEFNPPDVSKEIQKIIDDSKTRKVGEELAKLLFTCWYYFGLVRTVAGKDRDAMLCQFSENHNELKKLLDQLGTFNNTEAKSLFNRLEELLPRG